MTTEIRAEEENGDRMLDLYRSAGEMETSLRIVAERNAYAPLTETQVSDFNRLLEEARVLVPRSVALTEDVETLDEGQGMTVGDAYRAFHVTILPAIHNALPENEYATV